MWGLPCFWKSPNGATPNSSTLLVMIFLGETNGLGSTNLLGASPNLFLVMTRNIHHAYERGCLIWTGDCIIVISAGWWFGTCFIFHNIWDVILPIDFRIFQRGRYNTNQSGLVYNKKETGWWFGTFFIFPYIGNNLPNWLMFFRGVETTNQKTRGLRPPNTWSAKIGDEKGLYS